MIPNGNTFHENFANGKIANGEAASLPPQSKGSQAGKEASITSTIAVYAKQLACLYLDSYEAKIWGVAARGLQRLNPPTKYPEYTKPGGSEYVYREYDFWTSGFFPGSLYLVLQRRAKWSHLKFSSADEVSERLHPLHLLHACKFWTEKLHQNASLNNTHDIGLMIMPWARPAYELHHDNRALETIKLAAITLLSRFRNETGCIRSWDRCTTKTYTFDDPDADYMVIIDNMMNLDLLFYAASKTDDQKMFAAAVKHARTTARTHVRPDGSTTHLIVLDPRTGSVKQRLTNQGYKHTSCWARGQSWAIAGFAETFHWTHETEFLVTAMRCADYFLDHLPDSGVIPWDFDAARVEREPQPSDSSAAMIAAYGLLLIHQALVAQGRSSRYATEALWIVRAVCANHINEPAQLVVKDRKPETVEIGTREEPIFSVDVGTDETILTGATINNYEHAPQRWANHGLVYADYYFLLVGNKLLEMGIGASILKEVTV